MNKEKVNIFLEKLIILDKKDKSKIEYIKGYLDAKLSDQKNRRGLN